MGNLYYKKKYLFVPLVMCVIILLTSSAVFAAEVANVTFNEENPFADWVIMNYNDTSKTTVAAYDFIKNPGRDDENDKCFHVGITGPSSSDEVLWPFIQKGFTSGTIAEISYEFRIKNENATESMPFRKSCPLFNVRFEEGNLNFFFIDQNGNLCYQESATQKSVSLGVKIENDKSYKYKVIIRNTDKTFDVELDGVKINAEPIGFPNEVKGGFMFVRMMTGGKNGYDYYLDDIKIETYYPMSISSTSETENAEVDSFTVNFSNAIDTERFSNDCISIMHETQEVPFTYIISENVLRINFSERLNYETDYILKLSNIYDTDGRMLEETAIDLNTCERPPLKAEITGTPMVSQRAAISHNSDTMLEKAVWKKSLSADGEFTEFAQGGNILLNSEVKGMYIKAETNFADGSAVETAVFGPVKENENIALGAAAEADSSLSGYGAELMFDGKSDTRWAGNSKNGYINIDLGNTAQINMLEFDSMGERFEKYSILCSADKLNWETLDETESESASQWNDKTFSHKFNTVSARYFKIKYTVFAEFDSASIYEIRLLNSSKTSPIVSKPTISGEISAGSVISAEYEKDSSNNADAAYTYIWEKADTADGEYTVIEGVNSKDITILKDCLGKYLRVTVLAQNKENECFTKAVSSVIGPVETAKPSAPYAYGIKTEGKVYTGETLEFTYIYEDVNDDIEGDSEYRILSSKNADMSDSTVLKNGVTSAADKVTYTLTKNDADRYIAFEITPVSVTDPKTGIAVTGSPLFVRDIPGATDVTAKISADGSSLVGEYKYSHANGSGEKNSTYKWYRSSSNGNFEEIKAETGRSYVLQPSDYGKYFKFEVTPCCEAEPKTGNPVLSDAVYVNGRSGGSSSSGGGGGGGGYVNSNVTVTGDYKTNNKAVQTAAVFADIDGHWARESIERLYKLGVLNGTGDNKYEPERAVTKAEFTAVLMRTFEVSGNNECNFTDVSEKDWFYSEVAKAASAGVISGFDGKFNPYDVVLREQAAKIITELYYIQIPPLTKAAPSADFKDMDLVSPWAVEYVNACVKYELMNGVSEEYFAPQENITRAQMAVIVKRLVDKILVEE